MPVRRSDGCKVVAFSKFKENSRLRPAKLATPRALAGGRWWRTRATHPSSPQSAAGSTKHILTQPGRLCPPSRCPSGCLGAANCFCFWFNKALRPAGEWATRADRPLGREDRQVRGHRSTEAGAFCGLTTDSSQIRACQDAWMTVIDSGAPMKKQLKAELKLMFEDFMTPQQRRGGLVNRASFAETAGSSATNH